MQDQWHRCISDCDESIRLNPHFGDAYVLRAAAHVQLQDISRAGMDFDAAVRIAPSNSDYVCRRMNFLSKIGRFKDALAACTKLLEMEPAFAPVWRAQRGCFHVASGGAREEALDDFRASLQSRLPESARAGLVSLLMTDALEWTTTANRLTGGSRDQVVAAVEQAFPLWLAAHAAGKHSLDHARLAYGVGQKRYDSVAPTMLQLIQLFGRGGIILGQASGACPGVVFRFEYSRNKLADLTLDLAFAGNSGATRDDLLGLAKCLDVVANSDPDPEIRRDLARCVAAFRNSAASVLMSDKVQTNERLYLVQSLMLRAGQAQASVDATISSWGRPPYATTPEQVRDHLEMRLNEYDQLLRDEETALVLSSRARDLGLLLLGVRLDAAKK